MKAIKMEFCTRAKERELEGNYLPNLLKYLIQRWIIHYDGFVGLQHLLFPMYNTYRTFVDVSYRLQGL
jgi:hypothetical protein